MTKLLLNLGKMQAEAGNLDIVTKAALLAQENQQLQDQVERQTQQLLHMQQEVGKPKTLHQEVVAD